MSELKRIENELRLAGYRLEPVTNEEYTDDDYVQAIGNSVYDTLKTFMSHEHSGFSAQCAINMIIKLLKGETLTPLTNDPKEWLNCSSYYKNEHKEEGNEVWQSLRDTSCFSKDGLKTYYDIDEECNREWELDETGKRTGWSSVKPDNQLTYHTLHSKEELAIQKG